MSGERSESGASAQPALSHAGGSGLNGFRAPHRVLFLGACFVALALGACSGCKEKRAGGGAVAAPVAPELWLQGKLPPEVYEGTPVRGGVLVIRAYTEPPGLSRLHDQLVEGNMVKYTIGPVYEALAEIDRDTYELKPLLAESWEESPDHLTHTIRLRRGVRFHNGEAFSANDLLAVIDAVMNPKNLTVGVRSFFTELERYEARDEYTVVLHWKKPYVLALRNFLTTLPMLPASALKGDFNTLPIHRAPIGTGPFKFVSWETGKAITFTRNEDYWGPQPYLDGYVMRIVKDHTVATQMWERGDFDVMTAIQPSVWKSVEAPDPKNAWAVEGYNRIRFEENNYSWIGWNEERPLFRDRDVRRALAMLFPRDRVFKEVDLGLEQPTTCPYYRRPSGSCDRTVQPIPYDPREAKELLEAAGWVDTNQDGVLDRDGVPFRFTFLANPHSVRLAKLLPILQEEYRRVGIEMDIEKVETAVYFDRLRRHDFDACSLVWASLDADMDIYQVFHSSQAQGGSNYVSYPGGGKGVDELLERIRVEFDPQKRIELERQVHRQLYDDQVYTFLTVRPLLDAAKKRVRGIKPSLGWYDLRKIWIAPDASPDASK